MTFIQPLLLSLLPRSADCSGVEPLALDYAARRRSRQRIELADGRVLAIALPAGSVLQPGDLLGDAGGIARYRVVARPQPLLRVAAADPLLLARAAYHLGNRHCTIQVQPQALLLEPDPVLREMLLRLGARVDDVDLPFEPESGAYGGGHRHGHADTFASDHALAQAAFRLHEPRRQGVLLPAVDHDG